MVLSLKNSHWTYRDTVRRRDFLGSLTCLPAIVLACHFSGTTPEAPISILDYGARGQPGIDDTLAFTRAIAAATSSRRGLYIPSGRYEVTQIDVPSGLVSVEGPGWLVARTGETAAVVRVSGNATHAVRGLRLSVNIDAASIARRGVFCTGLVESQIVDCQIVNLTHNDGDGIRISFPASRNNVIARNNVTLADVVNGTHPDGLRGIHIVGETASPAGGIDQTGSPVRVTNSVTGHQVLDNKVTGGTHGIAFFGSQDIEVRNNECRGQSARNIIASPSVERGEIVANRCLEAGSSGIHLADGTRMIKVHDNLVSSLRSGLTDDDDAAIQAYVGCRDIQIIGNEVRGDWRYGVAVTLVENVTVEQNRLIGPFRQASVAIESDYVGLQPPRDAPFARAREMPWRNALATRNISLVDNDYGTAPIAIGLGQYRGRSLVGVTIHGGKFDDAVRPLAIYQDQPGAITDLLVSNAAVRRDPRNLLHGLTIGPP